MKTSLFASLFATSALATAALASAAPSAFAQETHVHGDWSLFAAQEGKTIAVTISGPLEDVLGFEHAPKTDADHEAVERLEAKVTKSAPWVAFNSAAACSLEGTPRLILPEGFDHDDHHHDDDHDHDEHHEHEHEEDHEHDDHHEDHHDDKHGDHEGHKDREHGNADISYRFTCNSINRLDSLNFKGFAAFPSIKTVEAVMLMDGKQKAHDLTPSKPTLSLK